MNQRALANTVEQLAAFAPALLAVAARAPAGWMPSVVAAGLVFGLARLAFWGGYMVGPLGRSPGMAATYAINVVTLVSAVSVWWPSATGVRSVGPRQTRRRTARPRT